MPMPYGNVFVPDPMPADPPPGETRSHHRVVLSGHMEGQQWINIHWLVLDFPTGGGITQAQKNDALAEYVDAEIVQDMRPVVNSDVNFELIEVAAWESGSSDPDTGPPSFRSLTVAGTRPGTAPPSYVTTPVIAIYTAHDDRSRIRKTSLPPLPEADYANSFVGPGLTAEFASLVIAMYEDAPITITAIEGRVYSVVRAWTGALDIGGLRIYESKPIDYVYVSALAGTMRRRKWGRGT